MPENKRVFLGGWCCGPQQSQRTPAPDPVKSRLHLLTFPSTLPRASAPAAERLQQVASVLVHLDGERGHAGAAFGHGGGDPGGADFTAGGADGMTQVFAAEADHARERA